MQFESYYIRHPKKRNELLDEQFEKPNDLKILTLTLFKSRQIAIIKIQDRFIAPTVEFQTQHKINILRQKKFSSINEYIDHKKNM